MYYNKEEIKREILNCHKEAMETKLKPLVSIEEAFKKIEEDEDVVGYFWMTIDKTQEVGLKMSSRMYIKIEHDLYTDDRFAIDLYHAQVEGKSIGDVIRERMKSIEENKKSESAQQLIQIGFKEKLISKLNSEKDE